MPTLHWASMLINISLQIKTLTTDAAGKGWNRLQFDGTKQQDDTFIVQLITNDLSIVLDVADLAGNCHALMTNIENRSVTQLTLSSSKLDSSRPLRPRTLQKEMGQLNMTQSETVMMWSGRYCCHHMILEHLKAMMKKKNYKHNITHW